MRRVIKLGGSLLDWPDWPAAWRAWRRHAPVPRPAEELVITGGGARVEQLRRLDGRTALGELACHQIAIRFMVVAAHRVAQQMGWPMGWPGDWPVRPHRDSPLDASRRSRGWCSGRPEPSLVDMESALEVAASRRVTGWDPPADWQVTSDSLAAWLAWAVEAEELVLLKSCDPPQLPGQSGARVASERGWTATATQFDSWVAAGCVDRYLPRAVRPGMPVTLVNLRRFKDESAPSHPN